MLFCRKCQCDTFSFYVTNETAALLGTDPIKVNTVCGLEGLTPNYFQMDRARMMSEKRTFAAFESLSVPMTMRIAQDSNWA